MSFGYVVVLAGRLSGRRGMDWFNVEADGLPCIQTLGYHARSACSFRSNRVSHKST